MFRKQGEHSSMSYVHVDTWGNTMRTYMERDYTSARTSDMNYVTRGQVGGVNDFEHGVLRTCSMNTSGFRFIMERDATILFAFS